VEGELRDKTIAFVKETLKGAEGGHDWSHVERVRKLSSLIRDLEGKGDPEVIELSALLHDIADPKFHGGDGELGGQLAYNFLVREGMPEDRAEHIRTIIKYISFKGGIPQDRIHSIEFQIVQDADRLDAMGAIGIARAFHYGGFRNLPLYDPSVPVTSYRTEKEYRESRTPTLNHFYEKLLKLKDLMNTETGRAMALERHRYMVEFLECFLNEWDPGRDTDH
jgi:uncharacterized protein